MPLPNGFSEWEHLQDTIRREHNKAVRAYFKNQADDDISTPKASLKHACLIKDDDSALMQQQRQWLFEVLVGRLQATQTPIYGIPVPDSQSLAKFRPQVQLYFRELQTSPTYDPTSFLLPVEGQISFRLMDETSDTISRTKAEALARKIKNEFCNPIFVWEKGWFATTYIDLEKGYQLKLFVKSKTEGERLVRQVLSIQNHTLDNDYLQFIEHDKTYPVNPGTHRVYGRTVKKPRKRPVANVSFRRAKLIIWGQAHAINLVSVGGREKSVIERV